MRADAKGGVRGVGFLRMNTLSRRELCVALSSFAALAAVAAEAQPQETGSLPETMAVPKPPGSAGDPVLATPHAFKFRKTCRW